jgi:Ser/Thr protein kinase RdoA (MazF antagonist)
VPPEGFTRPRWDAPALLGESMGIDLRASRDRLEPEQRTVIDAAMAYVEREMATLDEDPAAFGLIHADFHEGNYLFHRGQVRAIDFDNCGWGYYLYDIAVARSTLIGRFPARYPAMRAAFLQGYLLTRPIDLPPARREALIDMFLVARIRAHTLWQAGLLDNPVFRARAPARIALQVGIIRDLLQQAGK